MLLRGQHNDIDSLEDLNFRSDSPDEHLGSLETLAFEKRPKSHTVHHFQALKATNRSILPYSREDPPTPGQYFRIAEELSTFDSIHSEELTSNSLRGFSEEHH
ncbi:hypothetical protein QVD17_06601 [Tagetes erecta]|uniref:Uncharacterized protein n=1 Tax=Tagetes erecta TaxID=13708 RepID=A0AAD8LNQ4_TARER|nr:hypothetical protein QVD17_06601 [Tagetes erecta]